ncbi:MAG TPA: hypothetical protein PK472_13640, partial [Pseudomonadota bacterium]|nr:hypothetical protein [Pseudomonadota bacterium]
KQLLQLSLVASQLPFAIRFSVRSRFEPDLTADVLAAAHAAGLEEIWLGLESAVPRVRTLMKKGVDQPVVERILKDASQIGIRVRALCLLGYPGETADETRATIDFLDEHQHELASCALTPFLLMRRSPIGADPQSFGVTVTPDVRPRHERLRPSLAATWPGALGRAFLESLLDEASRRLGPHFLTMTSGPSLAHAMIHASVLRRGWPKSARMLSVVP